MNVVILIVALELISYGAFSLECKCNFDEDCPMFRNVEYINGKWQPHRWRRQDHQASGRSTYMYMPMRNNDKNVEAYIKSTTPIRPNGVNRCLSFLYKATSFPGSRLQVHIWPEEPTSITILFSKPDQKYEAGSWSEATVDIPGTTSGYLVFAGIQEIPTSQILLDDVMILEGECYRSKPYPEFPVGVLTTRGWFPWTTIPPFFTTQRGAQTTPPLFNDLFYRGGPYFTNDFNGDMWEMTLLNLPPVLTISKVKWSRTNMYPLELGIVVNYNPERGYFLYVPVRLNLMSPPPYSKSYLMSAHEYSADGQDKCLKLDYIQYQTSGNLGSLGIYMSSYFLTSDVHNFNGHLERLYKYPREGTYVYNSSPYWRSLQVTIPGSKRGYLFIEAVSGTGRGMIAVDNVTVFAGSCPNPNLL